MDPPFSSRMGPTAWVYLPGHSRRSRMAPPVHEFSAISASRPRSTPGFHMLDHLQEQAYALAELKLSCKWYVPVVAHARLTEEERGIKPPPGFARIFDNSAHVFRFFLDEQDDSTESRVLNPTRHCH